MLKITMIGKNQFTVMKAKFNNYTKTWTKEGEWERLGPIGLEMYLEKNKIEAFEYKPAISALINYKRKAAYFDSKNKLYYIV